MRVLSLIKIIAFLSLHSRYCQITIKSTINISGLQNFNRSGCSTVVLQCHLLKKLKKKYVSLSIVNLLNNKKGFKHCRVGLMLKDIFKFVLQNELKLHIRQKF